MTSGSSRKEAPQSGVADDLELDPVPVHEIEAAAGVVIAVGEGDEAGGEHALLDRVEIVDLDADMVEWRALRPAAIPVFAGLGIDGEIIGVVADMDDAAAVAGRALPADAPAEQVLQQSRRPLGLADGDVHMFDEAGAHDFVL